MTTLAQLEQLIGPPLREAPAADWNELGQEYGLKFPRDYIALTERYPELVFNEFLTVFHPCFSDAAWNDRMLNIPRSWQPKELSVCIPAHDVIPVEWGGPFSVYPKVNGLFPWGITVNGDYCMWLTNRDPALWTVVIANRFKVWHYRGSIVNCLNDLLSRQVDNPLFPDDFPGNANLIVEQIFP
ncbi:hypothetical protein [Actinomadura hibisca]|uniref:hypothetical protein n=1 Tax=Actinomadura hibisca TaxID=68565 RepID=UPI0012F87285|nr:hypothetical protein [Actinomadura hibisca]